MKPSNILFIASVASMAWGLTDVGTPIYSGFARAIGSVFFILSFIARVVEKAEATA